jgi:NAD(P)-dependent dehydrogenase (short-subunit alcohol dehydrogenase family)
MTKTWFITGTSSGFGRQLTEILLERGDRVIATVRNPASIADLASKFAASLYVKTLDVSEPAAIRKVVHAAFSEVGRIDVVVSNAGYVLLGAAEEVNEDQVERQLRTNLHGSIYLAQAVIPHLRHQGGGRIIQISSSQGQSAYPTMGVYAASKWGIEGFFEGTIPEIAPFGIEVTLVEPGASRTNFAGSSADAGAPLQAYDQTAVGEFRKLLAKLGPAMFRGDPRKVALAIIRSTDQTPAPRRLTLGSDAYEMIHSALVARLSELEAQKTLAHSTDYDV